MKYGNTEIFSKFTESTEVNHVFNNFIEELLRETKMILISIMQQDKIVFLILERKIKTQGATRSQSWTSNVEYI